MSASLASPGAVSPSIYGAAAASKAPDLSPGISPGISPGVARKDLRSVSPESLPGLSPVRGDVTSSQWKQAREWMYNVSDPWDPCILALDGGGIRGYSSALILRRLMHEIFILEHELEEQDPAGEVLPTTEDDLLPCHYFDFMYGTSTGGLIAVMLARLRLSIGECLEQYRIVGHRLFGHRKSIIPLMTKYPSEPLERAVKDMVEKVQLGTVHPWDAHIQKDGDAKIGIENTTQRQATVDHPIYTNKLTQEPSPVKDAARNDSVLSASMKWDPALYPPWDPHAPRVAQSCCLTAIHDRSVQRAHLLRSYPHYPHPSRIPNWITPYNLGADPLEIWQVARATSAAPFYFDVLEAVVDGHLRGHKDGGIRENNPSGAAWSEFVSLYHPKDQPALLLSVGTGRTSSPPDGFTSALPFPLRSSSLLRKIAENISVIPNLLVKYTESETQHAKMVEFARSENTWYKRLNVSSGLDRMPLDDWVKGEYSGEVVPGGDSLKRMEEATAAYLTREMDREVETFVAPGEMLRHSAEKLVRVRRARRKMGGERWDVFLGKGLKERMRAQCAGIFDA